MAVLYKWAEAAEQVPHVNVGDGREHHKGEHDTGEDEKQGEDDHLAFVECCDVHERPILSHGCSSCVYDRSDLPAHTCNKNNVDCLFQSHGMSNQVSLSGPSVFSGWAPRARELLTLLSAAFRN